jgi:hypothetical protein
VDDSVSRTVFESVAWLHAPADDPETCALVEAADDWVVRPEAFDGQSSAVWGRMPVLRRSGRGSIRAALARERSLLQLRRSSGSDKRCWEVERISPIGRRPRWEATVRAVLLSGALVRLGRGPARARVADRIAAQAGHTGARIRMRPSGDGSAVVRLRLSREGDVVLRLATGGGLKDARRNAEALSALGAGGVKQVPRLVRSGADLGVGWSTETTVPGNPVRRPSRTLIDDVVGWSASLPRAESPVASLGDRLNHVIRAFPQSSVAIGEALDRARNLARDLPGVLEHGDLWAGNLLADEGRLHGVVDWDNWHPAGMPGADLLHLFAMERRSGSRLEVGELWLERPWRAPAFRDATREYWEGLGIPLTDEVGWLAGVAWWAAQVSAALRRGRQPGRDPVWVERNVDNVVRRLGAGS